MTDEEALEWWLTKWNAKVYKNTKMNDNRSCDINCGHEWKVVIPNPCPAKDSLIGCADTAMEAVEILNKILFCSKHFEMILCSDALDYRDELKHKCDGIYCGAREQYEAMEKKFGKQESK